jgi:hypothetical protein
MTIQRTIRRYFRRLSALSASALCWTVTVALAGTPPQERVIVTGQGRVTEISYSSDLTATRAIIRAGGYSDFGGTPIYLIRCGESTHLDMKAIFRGELDKDPRLQPWDIISIGTSLTRHK